jgi:hypothetical protein
MSTSLGRHCLYTPTPHGFERFLHESLGLCLDPAPPMKPPQAPRHGALVAGHEPAQDHRARPEGTAPALGC